MKLFCTYPVLSLICFLAGFATSVKSQKTNLKKIDFGNVQNAGIRAGCCCGNYNELSFSNLDFEDGPQPPPNSFDTYGVGGNFGGWTVTRGTIDLVDGAFGGLGNGNPNGPSTFVDLHGTPGFGAISYLLTGLKPGSNYKIEFWTAQNGSGHTSTGSLNIAGGAWLSVSWNVSVSGSVFWFKLTYEFMAMAVNANMEFSSTGTNNFAGTLVDDIKIFECPADTEIPEIVNEPVDEEYACLKDVPNPSILEVTDDCDPNPSIQFSTSTQKLSDCEQLITRNWVVTDICGNKKNHSQLITVKDEEPPYFIAEARHKIIDCKLHSRNEFLRWVGLNGNAVLRDNCGNVTVQASYDSIPSKPCDSMLVDFIATDPCGNETYFQAFYIISDTISPIFQKKPEDVLLRCSTTARDSLRSWLAKHGNGQASDDCGEVFWSNDFKGDSSALDIEVHFFATDRCGNSKSSMATFKRLDGADTNRIQQYLCDRSPLKVDTILYKLPGCDSVVILTSLGVSPDTTLSFKTTCDHLHPKIVFVPLISQYGCDSIIKEEFQYIKPDTTFRYKFDCQIADTVAEVIVLNGLYCDSFLIEYFIPALSSLTKESLMTCDSSAVRTDSIFGFNQFGCDSIHLIEYLLSKFNITHKDSSICGLVSEYTDTLLIQKTPCDSLVVTHYRALPTDTTHILKTSCDPASAGNFVHYYTNQYSCDSVVLESIQFLESDTVLLPKFVCDIQETGVDTIYIRRSGSCDSVVLVEKIFSPSDSSFVLSRTCDPLEAGRTYTQLKGQYCDSIIVLDRILSPSYQIQTSKTTCFSDSLQTDTFYFQSHLGCDSIVLVLKMHKPLDFTFEIKDVSCFGDQDGSIVIFPDKDFSGPYRFFLNGSEIQARILDLLGKGTYQILIQDQQGCFSTEKKLEIMEPAPLTVDIGPDLFLNHSEDYSFASNSSRIGSRWEWEPANRFACPHCEKTLGNFEEDTQVSLLVYDEKNCSARDSLFIFVKEEVRVHVPNGFSPNGDQVNDWFYVHGNPELMIERMEIYDRWGQLVFERNQAEPNRPDHGWDGTHRGQLLVPGVYVYSIKIRKPDGTHLHLHGDLSLIR
ncbi:MAG: gliding motility-associated C-terminal domain-containing protein [Saprospiraceae bacterium]|nr:gliding motility-associated C-terminal domain-containing protein [Saprospiraceae bacterium]